MKRAPGIAWTVRGATVAENMRAALVRAYFLDVLLQDDRVADLFDEWARQTGLGGAADAVAEAGERLTRVLGVEHWTELGPKEVESGLVAGGEYLAAMAEADLPPVAAGPLGELAVSFAALLDRIDELDLGEASVTFVSQVLGLRPDQPGESLSDEELDEYLDGWLRWEWLSVQLVASFLGYVVDERACGLVVGEQTFTISVPSPPAPAITWQASFETRAGETVAEASARLEAAGEDALRAFAGAFEMLREEERRYAGRQPADDTAHLQAWAEWFYRSRVKRPPESIRSLGREYAEQQRTDGATIAYDGRRQVQHGINEAERLLGLVGVADPPCEI